MFAINTTINAIAQILDPSWIFLDDQSTDDLSSNADLLIDMHEVDEGFIIHCNIGKKQTRWKPYLNTDWSGMQGMR